jgi:hypothetical protein
MSIVFEALAIAGTVFSVGHGVVNAILSMKNRTKQKNRHNQVMELLQPKDIPSNEPTPQETKGFGEPVPDDDFVEMKRYYNKRTGKMEYLYQAPETARGNPVPQLKLR